MVVAQDRPLKRTNYIAVASIISTVLGILLIVLDIVLAMLNNLGSFREGGPFFLSRILMLTFFAVAVVLGVISLFVIHSSIEPVKGKRYAVTAIILSGTLGSIIFAALFMSWQVGKVRDERLRARGSETNIRRLGRTIIDYAQSHGDCLPVADQWCDLLLEYDKSLSRDTFKNPRRLERVCGFAFNKNLGGLHLADILGNTVLLVETDGSWNANGDAKLLRTKQQKKDIVTLVLFVDGAIGEYWYSISDVRFVEDKSHKYSYSPLRWNP